METNLEDSIVSYPSVDHLVMDIHPSNMEVSWTHILWLNLVNKVTV